MESDGNQLYSGKRVCNAIYTSSGWHKPFIYFEPCKRLKSVTMSMRTVGIPNLDIKVWNRKNELPLCNYLRSLTQP